MQNQAETILKLMELQSLIAEKLNLPIRYDLEKMNGGLNSSRKSLDKIQKHTA